MCTSFKTELLRGVHNFSAASNIFKLALYTNTGTAFDATTTTYRTANEASGTNYTAGGNPITTISPTSPGSGTPSVAVLDFGSDKAASAGDFTVVMPTGNASNAIIRIA